MQHHLRNDLFQDGVYDPRENNSFRAVLLLLGGIPPLARRPPRIALTLVEREDISRGIASGASLREIARHLDRAVSTVLLLDWPPEQISRWLKTQYPDDRSMRVSHDTIYRSLFIQARGVLKKELLDQLR